MPDLADNVATTALVIAVLALFIAIGQFTQQIFGTAEGYRRCQDSVIGPWARLTRLSWRWQGIRFETKFTTPVILFLPEATMYHQGLTQKTGDYFLRLIKPEDDKSALSWSLAETIRYWIWIRREQKGPPAHMVKKILSATTAQQSSENLVAENMHKADAVTWMPLLRALIDCERRYEAVTSYGADPPLDSQFTPLYSKLRPNLGVTLPALRLVERSWDLIPPEVVRPYAQTTLGNLITVVSRLGMGWQSFNPNEGSFNAQGRGHSISAINIRGLGTLCEYRFDFTQKSEGRYGWDTEVFDMYIGGRKETDMFCCGIVPSVFPDIKDISLVAQHLSDLSPIYRFLDLFPFQDQLREDILSTASIQTSENPRAPRLFNDKLGLVVCEVIGVVAPFMPLLGSIGANIPWPLANRRLFATTIFWESRAAYLYRLKEIVAHDPTDRLTRVLKGMNKVEEEFGDTFYCRWHQMELLEKSEPRRKAHLIEFCRAEHYWTTLMLFGGKDGASQADDEGSATAKTILDWHLTTTVGALDDNLKYKSDDYPWVGPGKPQGHKTLDWVLELAKRLLDGHENAVRERRAPFSNEADRELWWVMVYRSFLWYVSVRGDRSQNPLPSIYYDSKMPVYIG
ncbi:hypothetical protein EJ04DRAFT_340655 [Polyplosphaeria fusca]|uniref:Uncharacterized protein n=1 Tax=Polyplosphaeria fusca TaxID=682080 RepID=A0A9P4QW48_9PLEO|nr:hypothetical protein EJ04DRAFT_340655 [Polyplosphaeria fusca]